MPERSQSQRDDPDHWVIPLAVVALIAYLLQVVVPVAACLLLAGAIRLATEGQIVLSAGCFFCAGWLVLRWFRQPL